MKTIDFVPLETQRLRLVAPDVKYAKDVFEYSRDKEFCRFIDAKPAARVQESVFFLENLIQDNVAKKRAYWIIIDKKSDSAIGTLGFIFSVPIHYRVLEFGYGLSRSYWGTGVFQEAAKEILKFGFDTLNLERIQLFTRENNIASIKAVQKLGFVKEGVLKSFYETDAGRINSVVLGLLKNQFLRIYANI